MRGYKYLNIEPSAELIEEVKADPSMIDNPSVIKKLHNDKELYREIHANMKRFVKGCRK